MGDKKTIYIAAEQAKSGDYFGYAFIENEGLIASHFSSNEAFVRHDMGITSDWKHDRYDKECPDGWELEYLGVMSREDLIDWANAHGCGAESE